MECKYGTGRSTKPYCLSSLTSAWAETVDYNPDLDPHDTIHYSNSLNLLAMQRNNHSVIF